MDTFLEKETFSKGVYQKSIFYSMGKASFVSDNRIELYLIHFCFEIYDKFYLIYFLSFVKG